MIKELVLVPCNLSQDEVSVLFKERYFLEQLKSIECFWVENIRSARRFISACKTGRNIEEIPFELLDKKTSREKVSSFYKKYAGQRIGILSESGCPGIADPGSRAVEIAHQKGVKVVPMIGPSSILLALMASGMNGQRFCFHGYIPIDKAARKKAIKELERESLQKNQTQLFIETPYRNNQLFQELLTTCNDQTFLCVGSDISGKKELILTKRIKEWRKVDMDLHKIPTIFLIYAI